MSGNSSNPKNTISFALEEYKIIQTKIDNIGDYCHRVKGWSLTITAGILAGTITTDVPCYWALGAILPTLLFSIGDDSQKKLRGILVLRALQIEQELRSVCELEGASVGFPSLATSIRLASHAQGKHKLVWRGPKNNRWNLWRVYLHNREWVTIRYDKFFYFGQYLLAAIVAFWLWHNGKPHSELQTKETAILSSLTNSPLWNGATTYIVITNSSPLPISYFSYTNYLISTNYINISVPMSLTNIINVTNSMHGTKKTDFQIIGFHHES